MKAWRDSATVILASRQIQKRNPSLSNSVFQYDYKLLNLKRHGQASFMPGAYVFPGGTVEPSDADLKWKNLFSSFGFNDKSFASLLNPNSSRPPIFKPRKNELRREISLRITAIRETFEECGILICNKPGDKGVLTDWAKHLVMDEAKSWQSRVHNDPMKFYRMCEDHQCYPNIWALHEWSNWLTPTVFAKRFDTVFFFVCMQSQPLAEFEEQEMEDLVWLDPKSLLSSSKEYRLEIPQLYELGRIARYESLNNLLDFTIARSKHGMHRIFPVRVRLSDGHVVLLPGDCMYPKNPSYTERQEFDRTTMTIAEFHEQSSIRNRIEVYSLDVKSLSVDNMESLDGHLPPLCIDNVQIKSSKL
ncbi:nucleoside diphosphate-linked moiety X motif 19 [Venturia canescens]|uniref:nucleoside diphosphate-linked moiety X motif 19 n=1 Tax=Venturia canescens TaxID=32260 RepID=UPI001C9C55EA|nr:nucleoside diphosphate-linked moiety X motif 19 [Venturia canescens]